MAVARDIDTMAELIDEGHVGRRCLDSSAFDIPDLATAYAVQESLTRRRLARGDALVGWKLGYTTAVMRAHMGVDAPNFGPLLASMQVGPALPPTIHPRVEPEIALVLDRDPGPHASAEEVLRCCRSAHLALEVVDSVWWGYRFDLEHNTADGSSAAGFALGGPLPLDIDGTWDVSVVVGPADAFDPGRAVEIPSDATGSASMRAAAESASWLATELASRPTRLAPGDILLTGGLTRAHALPPYRNAVAVARVGHRTTASVSLFGSAA